MLHRVCREKAPFHSTLVAIARNFVDHALKVRCIMTMGVVHQMASVAEITVQLTNDPNVWVYHTRFELVSAPEVGLRGCVEEVGAFGRLILEIRGVVQVNVGPYMLLVTKAPLFAWPEIDPSIQAILKTFAMSQRQIEDAHAESPFANIDRVEGRESSDSRVA